MARGGKFGWFLGLVFGTLFGVLFAPRKGKELRQRMKADRKKGKLGIAPLHDDLKFLGHEIASIAKDIYQSEPVQDIVEKGRRQVKELSNDFVGEVADFHKTRIAPLTHTAKSKSHEMQQNIKHAKHDWNDLKKKVKASAKVGKRAAKEIKSIMKKKER